MRGLAAATLAGVAVKLMDDALDRRLDEAGGRENSAARLGESVTAYALAALALGAAAEWRIAVSVFLAAYAVGMAGGLFGRLPSGLLGWQEAALALALGLLAVGVRGMGGSLLMVAGAQLADDLLDRSEDGEWDGAWVWGLGIPGASLGLALVWLAAAALDLPRSLALAGGWGLVQLLPLKKEIRR